MFTVKSVLATLGLFALKVVIDYLEKQNGKPKT
jgi:hypothetical protein